MNTRSRIDLDALTQLIMVFAIVWLHRLGFFSPEHARRSELCVIEDDLIVAEADGPPAGPQQRRR